jgi:hypothetical protein
MPPLVASGALKPHAVETWKLSTDPQFVDKGGTADEA